MLIRNMKSHLLTSLLLGLSLFTTTIVMAEDATSFDIAEFHRILDAVNQSNIPDRVKKQLLRDMRNTLIENVQQANIPEDKKRRFIQDLESTTQE